MSEVTVGVRATLSSLDDVILTDENPSVIPYPWMGTRGRSWESCDDWFETMPGSLFQLTCLFFFLAFMGGGKNAVAATYTHVLCACAFLVFAIFGRIDACSVDMIVWGVILVVVNIVQVHLLIHTFIVYYKNCFT